MESASPSARGSVVLGIAGIILVSATLRLPVGALSPLAEQISSEIPLSASALGLLGTAPPVGFALSALVAPWLGRRIGLERAIVASIAIMLIGTLFRAEADTFSTLLIGTFILLLGAGIGNVLLPAAVKSFTPRAIGPMTAAYATIMSIGSAMPPLVSVGLADAVGWRLSLASWALVSAIALVPWIALLVAKPPMRAARMHELGEIALLHHRAPTPSRMTERQPTRRTTWGIAIAFSVSVVSAYATFAFLPSILQDRAGATAGEAGALLALFAVLTAPVAVITPVLTARLRTPTPIVLCSFVAFMTGYGGLLVAPLAAPVLWVTLIGLGQVLWPMCLALFSLRTSSPDAAASLSGRVQTAGYTAAAVTTLTLGGLQELTGDWAATLAAMLVIVMSLIVAIPLLARD